MFHTAHRGFHRRTPVTGFFLQFLAATAALGGVRFWLGKAQVMAYEELGAEALQKLEVEDFPVIENWSPPPAALAGMRAILWTAIFWSWTKPQWWT